MREMVFLDRDGVVNAMVVTDEGLDSPQRPEDFVLLPGAAAAIRQLNVLGHPVAVVSNQPGIAKGKCTAALLEATNQVLRAELAAAGAQVDAIFYCLHHPDAVELAYRAVCDCRKPRPGLLLAAASYLDVPIEGAFMVGDQVRDLEAGQAVGAHTILVRSGVAHPDGAELLAEHVCDDLSRAVEWIEQQCLTDTIPVEAEERTYGNLR